MIIEKPIFWIRNKKVSNLEVAKNLLNLKNNKIFVNLPMVSLANQIKKKNKSVQIKKFDFNYFTRGKNQFENIPIDLLPHALSFFFTIKSNNLKNFKIIKISKKKKVGSAKLLLMTVYVDLTLNRILEELTLN